MNGRITRGSPIRSTSRLSSHRVSSPTSWLAFTGNEVLHTRHRAKGQQGCDEHKSAIGNPKKAPRYLERGAIEGERAGLEDLRFRISDFGCPSKMPIQNPKLD